MGGTINMAELGGWNREIKTNHPAGHREGAVIEMTFNHTRLWAG
jgi:hypothetical protein